MKNHVKKRFLLIRKVIVFILLVSPFALMAQNISVRGTVFDDLGDPVIGANVVVKGTTHGTITDIEGSFSLNNVSQGATLQISYLGYVTKEVRATTNLLAIILEEDTQALQEVVVTGYGGVQKAKTMTAAAAVVKIDQIARLPVTTIGEGLGGRVTGVVTQQASGAPGETTKIWVRGGSKVLYVIDDVVMETAQGEVFFNRLRPDDIAAMSILKDASATAIYGPRANDGVVVIQTKRGQDGAPEITFSQKVSILTPSYRAKPMSAYQYAQTRNALAFNSFEESPTYNNETMSKYYMGELWQNGASQSEIMNLVNQKYNMNYSAQDIADLFDPYKTTGGNIQDYYATYDPWDQFNHTQPMYQTNISLRGGSERLKYYSSLGYMNQKGVSSTYNYEQVNIILNTDAYLLNDKSLKFSLNINGNNSTQKKPGIGDSVFNEAMYGHSMPTRPEQWSNGKARNNSVPSHLNTGFNNTEDYRAQINASLKWSLPWVQGLSAGVSVNFNTSYDMNKTFKHDQEEVYSNPASELFTSYNADNANLLQTWNNYRLLTGIYQLDYARSFGKHNVAAMVNYQTQKRHTNNTFTKMKGYPTTLTPEIGHGKDLVEDEIGGTSTSWGSASYIGRVSYDYDGKYLLQYSANYNASLSYSPSQRWGFFQAVSAGWVLTEEEWVKNFISRDILSMFKIRGGYGIVGGEIGSPFDYINQYTQVYADEKKKTPQRVLFGDNAASDVAWRESKLSSNLTWSKSRQLSGGIDIGLFNDRLTGSFDVFLYKNNGEAMDLNTELVRTDIIGAPNTPQINAPFETSRKGGYEFSVNWQDRIGEVGYRLGVNFSHWDARVTRHTSKSTSWYYNQRDNIGLRDMHDVYTIGYGTNGLFSSWDQMYNALIHSGRNQSLGTFIIDDYNNDGVIGVADQIQLNAPGTVPLTQYGITVGGNWRGFDLEVFLQGASSVSGAMPSPLRSQQSYMWNYGQYAFQNTFLPGINEDVNAAVPTPVPEGNSWGYNYVDAWAFDASYLKLKNISFQYDFKYSLLKKVHLIKGLVGSFVVTNAFTWTKKSYPLKGLQDPEFITSGAGIYNDNGTLGSYPTQRSYTFNVAVTF